jgi:tartrate dehydrogenase/decarboxylase/D-malate dehydrogenase
MQTLTIAVIAGDGVGQEVIPQAKRVLEQAACKHDLVFAFQDFEWGAAHFFRWGEMMPSGALDLCRPATPSCWAPQNKDA